MRALILPLNKYFFHFEKYDGTTAPIRLRNKYRAIDKIMNVRFIAMTILAIVVIPLLLIYFLPILLWQVIRHGLNKGVDKFGEAVNAFCETLNKPPFSRRDIKKGLNLFKYRYYKLFVFYTDEMLPNEEAERKSFLSKLELMKQQLEFTDVFYAANKHSVEDIISKYKIDPEQSFFMSDGKIDLSSYRQLQ